MLDSARQAVIFAQGARSLHRKRTNPSSRQRRTDVEAALKRLRQAMKPIRLYLLKMPYRKPLPEDDAIRQASANLQRERRKLWKLLHPTKKKASHATTHRHPYPRSPILP